MADVNSVSDTQVLLQSMLQRLRLQPRPESNGTHTQDEVQHSTTLIEQNGGAAKSPPQTPPMYNFNISMDSKSIETNLAGPQSPGSSSVTTSLSEEFANEIVHNSGMSSTPNRSTLNLGFMGNCTVSGGNSDVSAHADDDDVLPKQARKQRFFLTKMRGGSVSSLQSIESLSPSAHTSSWTESKIQGQGTGQRRWSQKLKEKWKKKHKSTPRREQDDRARQEQNNMANSIKSPVPVQTMPNENHTTAAFNKEPSVQHQLINNGPVEGLSSPLDHMSETLFSPGYFNLMEEIFIGQEWAKFLPSSPSSSSVVHYNSMPQDQEMGLISSISQSRHNEQTMHSQWNYREAADPNFGMTQSQMNSGGFHNMDTTEYMSELHRGQYGASEHSGSNHLESMDLCVSTQGDNSPNKVPVYSYNQINPTELNVNPSLSSEQSVNRSQATEINNNHPGRVHEVLPRVDLSYLQPKDSSSLKTQVHLSRKRSHSTESRDSNERWGSETGEMHEWRNNSSNSDPAPSLSPASSTSSLQNSFSQDSELSVTTETVIKRRRMENTRHVRFAEEVTIVPPLVLYYDDGDADDEDYGQNTNEGNYDEGEELPPRQSVPRWIEALRSKTKKKPKLKLPRIRTKKYRFV